MYRFLIDRTAVTAFQLPQRQLFCLLVFYAMTLPNSLICPKRVFLLSIFLAFLPSFSASFPPSRPPSLLPSCLSLQIYIIREQEQFYFFLCDQCTFYFIDIQNGESGHTCLFILEDNCSLFHHQAKYWSFLSNVLYHIE